MRIALLHGWGFDASLWQAVTPLLAGFDCRTDERGYFGPTQEAGAADLVVTHSLGTLRALAAPPPGCRGIVAINGFDCFAARADFPAGVPTRLLDRMLARLDSDAEATLNDFRARCGAPEAPTLADPHALRADLRLLRDGDGRGLWRGPLALLSGDADPIVTPAHQAACFADRADAVRGSVPGGGHLLPLTAPAECADAIRALAARL